MIPLADIHRRAESWWPAVLKAELTGDSFFPKTVTKKPFPKDTPPAAQLAILDEVRDNAKELLSSTQQIGKRSFGYTYHIAETGLAAKNLEARLIEFSSLDDYLLFIEKTDDFSTFRKRTQSLLEQFPQLDEWAVKNVVKIIDLEPLWDRIITVLEFFRTNPMPNLYLRELRLPVHTKFIEQNVPLLDTLLELILPDEAIDSSETIFERKYGLQWVEPLIRICFFDEKLQKTCGETDGDFGLPVRSLAARQWPAKRVIVIENLTTLVSLRNIGIPRLLGLHGHGYRVANFAALSWLHDCELYYWGDIDVQGFEILSLFRRSFPHAKSLFMDRATIEQTHESFIGQGKPSRWRSEPQLTDEELEAYHWARSGWRQIEQEHLPIDWVVEQISNFVD